MDNTELELMRLRAAIAGTRTPIVMLDRERVVTYVNDATRRLVRTHEAALRSLYAGFDAERLVGSCIDMFHATSAQLRQLLANPANLPFSTDVRLGPLVLDIHVTAQRDAAGNCIGCTLECNDITEQKEAERQVTSLTHGVLEGDLGARIDSTRFQGSMRSMCDGVNALLDAVARRILQVDAGVDPMSRGDLRLQGEHGGPFLELEDALNGCVTSLAETVSRIRSASTSITLAAGDRSSCNMREASRLATSAHELAMQGGALVQDAVVAMAAISESSRKIADTLGVIDEIAFHTNLLALNAAVEAARAGEQGRGFADVASEVRNLAQRSAGAAREVRTLVNDSVRRIDEGSRLVNASGLTLTEIVAAVRRVADSIPRIAAASAEQSSAPLAGRLSVEDEGAD